MLAPEYNDRGEGVADGVDAVRAMVRRNVKYGVDVIKYCGTGGVFSKGTRVGRSSTRRKKSPRSSTKPTCTAARSRCTRTAQCIKVAAQGRVDTIEHASLIDQEGLDLAKKTGAFLSMTFSTPNTRSPRPQARRDGGVPAQGPRSGAGAARQFPESRADGHQADDGHRHGVHPHKDAPKQLAYMVQYGMTPMQAIQAATKVGAEALGIDAEVGQIAPGYSADIVAVTRDPLTDIHALDAVEFVMQQGTVYKQ